MKGLDANDRLRNGTLPHDPLAGAVPIAPDVVATKPVVTFQTYGEIRDAVSRNPRTWIVPGLLPTGALVLLIGTAKRAGKSTFAWALASAIEHGTAFLGFDMEPGRVVILTEEADPDIADKIERFRMDPASGALLTRSARPRPTLPQAAGAAILKASEIGAKVLVVDTLAHWASLPGASENDAGSIMDAIDPLLSAAAAGLLVLLIHHPSKTEGREGGSAARGSSALPGAVDATFELRPDPSSEHPTRRRLHVESRAVSIKDYVVQFVEGNPELGAPARFDLVGDAGAVARESTDSQILAFLSSRAPEWQTREAVFDGVNRRSQDLKRRLPALYADGRVTRIGRGRARDPHRYAMPGTPLPEGYAESGSGPVGSPSGPGTRPRSASRVGSPGPAVSMTADRDQTAERSHREGDPSRVETPFPAGGNTRPTPSPDSFSKGESK